MSRDILLSLIDPDPEQPRQHFDETKIAELAQSMDASGLAVPVSLRPVGDRYIIIHGERRWRAARLLDWQAIRAEVRDITPAKAFKLALIENVQRASLSPVEEAKAFKRLINSDGVTQAEVGELIGKSQQFVADRLALIKLPDEVKDLVTARAVSPSIARRLVSIDDSRTQKRLARQAAKGNLTVKDIERAKAGWKKEQDQARGEEAVFAAMVEDAPELAQYAKAVKKGELELDTYALTIKVSSLTREFLGQSWHWPKYSGARWLTSVHYGAEEKNLDLDRYGENLSLPVFSEEEWSEFWSFAEVETLEALEIPGREFFCWGEKKEPASSGVILRRIFDPAFGRLFAKNNSCVYVPGGAFRNPKEEVLFVKKGWGFWCIVEFNDGHGGRIRRRHFSHDHIGCTLIQQAFETVDPFAFSHHNFKQLELWQLQKHKASFFYYRRETLTREDAIAALELDLERMRNAKELNEDDLTERALDWLQEYIPKAPDRGSFREGACSLPRSPDGKVEKELFSQVVEFWQS